MVAPDLEHNVHDFHGAGLGASQSFTTDNLQHSAAPCAFDTTTFKPCAGNSESIIDDWSRYRRLIEDLDSISESMNSNDLDSTVKVAGFHDNEHFAGSFLCGLKQMLQLLLCFRNESMIQTQIIFIQLGLDIGKLLDVIGLLYDIGLAFF